MPDLDTFALEYLCKWVTQFDNGSSRVCLMPIQKDEATATGNQIQFNIEGDCPFDPGGRYIGTFSREFI